MYLFSIVETFSVGEGSVSVDLSLESAGVLGLGVSTHDADLVNLEERLEQITTANIEKLFNLIIARVFPETFVVKIGLINLDWGTLIAHHKLLEIEETQVP